MKVSYAECEAIVKTLPVGYYAKRRIVAVMSADAEASSYSPMNDTITISYKQISTALESVDDDSKRESLIRSSFYHEISHAILTPSAMTVVTPQLNIFEDERIETIFHDYYKDVDFYQNVLAINGGKINTPKTGMQAFYNAVRYRVAPSRILQQVDSIISAYETLNRTSNGMNIYRYIDDINELYKEISKDWKKNPETYTPPMTASASDLSPSTDEENDGECSESQTASLSKDKGGNAEGFESETTPPKNYGVGHGSEKNISDVLNNAFRPFAECLDKNQRDEMEKAKKQFELCISNFNKKNNGGCGYNTYSGVFNPRAVARDDYRFFERSMSVNGNNRFGTCHLNLFIDCSGSFWESETLVNAIIKALTDIEKRNRNFSLDVVFCGMGEKVSKNIAERTIKCDGGNCLDDELKDIVNRLQKKGTYNYNIVLFDGDAFSDFYGSTDEARKIFRSFDIANTTLITDADNDRYLPDSGFTSAKVIVTRDYTSELINHITKAMMIAFH